MTEIWLQNDEAVQPSATDAGPASTTVAGAGSWPLAGRTLSSRLIVGTGGVPSLEVLRRALDASANDEEALVDAISATYREWKTARSEPFARHHLAAAYAFGLARNHPYRDGNKRIAFLALVTFLGINGREFCFTPGPAVLSMGKQG